MPAAPTIDASVNDPMAALRGMAASSDHNTRVRRLGMAAGAMAAGVLLAVAGPRLANVFADAIVRAIHADPRWVVAAVAFELASFGGYIALFWHVAGKTSPRIGLRASAEVSLAGAAATRLLPTAGAGGAALTFWSLRRAGQSSAGATRTLLTFLVILYSVFLVSILAAGTVLATGAVSSHVPFELAAAPAAAAAVSIAIALALAARHRDGREPKGRAAGRALGGAVGAALANVRRPHVRLLGAPAWWAFDMLVVWATFNAFGSPPAPVVLVLGYFLGQVANTLPIPGAASGGMVGAFLALGMPAEVVLPAVLAYRAIAIWTPVPVGAAAIGGLRRTVKRWAAEDHRGTVVPLPAGEPRRGLKPVKRARRESHNGHIAAPRLTSAA
jgi:uncharacterized membrane protein YbhN (UPF0104 family)